MSRGRPAVDITGSRYGKWTVVARAPSKRYDDGTTRAVWQCRCDCGAIQAVRGDLLRAGGSTQCRRCATHTGDDWRAYHPNQGRPPARKPAAALARNRIRERLDFDAIDDEDAWREGVGA